MSTTYPEGKEPKRMRWLVVGCLLGMIGCLLISVYMPPYTTSDLVQDIRALHDKAFPQTAISKIVDVLEKHNSALQELRDIAIIQQTDPNELDEIRKQLVLTTQDIQMLLNNDQFLKGEFDALTELVEEMHPLDDPEFGVTITHGSSDVNSPLDDPNEPT